MRKYILEIAKDRYVAYFPDSLSIFVVNGKTKQLIDMISENNCYEHIKVELPDIKYKDYKQILYHLNNNVMDLKPDLIGENLKRLVIHISNDCNLNCVYCYGNGGNYQSQRTLMTLQTLEKTLDTFYKIFNTIDAIQLFGGEPMMNPKLIKATCDYVKNHEKKTLVGIVSNGTLITDELLELVRYENLYVTISLDHKIMQDMLRVTKSGHGTYSLISQNIHRLQKVSNQPSALEVTYTKQHEENQISVNTLIKSLSDDFGTIPIHLSLVCTTDEKYKINDYTNYIESIEEALSFEIKEPYVRSSHISQYLTPIRAKKARYHNCNAGFDSISVATLGDIYPCSTFVDNEKFRISNVNDNYEDLHSRIMRMRSLYYEINKNRNGKCEECYVNSICSACLYNNYIETGDLYGTAENFCRIQKEAFDKILFHLGNERSL